MNRDKPTTSRPPCPVNRNNCDFRPRFGRYLPCSRFVLLNRTHHEMRAHLARFWPWPKWLLIGESQRGVAWSYFKCAAGYGDLTTRQPPSYYGLLTEALAAGEVHLKLIPDPKFLRLADPYAGPQATSRPHDMSFYRGKFYHYYGITPAVELMLPWHLLTGTCSPRSLSPPPSASQAFCWPQVVSSASPPTPSPIHSYQAPSCSSRATVPSLPPNSAPTSRPATKSRSKTPSPASRN